MIKQRPLPYQGYLPTRPLEQVDLLVIHCTELPDLATAREFGEHPLYPPAGDQQASHDVRGTGNSGHYYIDRNGTIEQWVDNLRIAHHVRGYNPRSIGVELVNRGRYPEWFDSGHQLMPDPYPAEQIAALLQLVARLQADLPALKWIAGHDELDQECIPAANDASVLIRRKLDPGPLFPWAQVLASCRLQRFPMSLEQAPG
jgi:N-acetylmuramoyl-L-alanine amidase